MCVCVCVIRLELFKDNLFFKVLNKLALNHQQDFKSTLKVLLAAIYANEPGPNLTTKTNLLFMKACLSVWARSC